MDPEKSSRLVEDLFHKQHSGSQLLAQFYIALERRYSQLQAHLPESEHENLQTLFKDKHTWSNARRIELRMITAMSAELVPKYLDRYLFDAQVYFTPEKHQFYRMHSDQLKDKDPEDGRELLLQMVEDLQHASVVRFLKKRFANILAARTNLLFFLTAFIFVFLYTFSWPLAWEAAFNNLIICVSAGLLGACFSMLTGMKKKLSQSSLQELRNQTRFVNILSRVTIGGGAALLLFFFAQSGLIGDKILPQFQHEPISEQMLTAKLERTIKLHTKLDHKQALNPQATQTFIQNCRDWLPKLRDKTPEEAQQTIQNWMGERLVDIWNTNIDAKTYQNVLNAFSQSMWDLVRKPGYLDNAARAQMLILCILVGFSEKLVPDLLNRAESRFRSSLTSPNIPPDPKAKA